MLSWLTEEHAAGKARDAGAQWHVVITEVAAVRVELAVLIAQPAAVHGVERPAVQLVTLQLTRLVVDDHAARQQPVTEKTDSVHVIATAHVLANRHRSRLRLELHCFDLLWICCRRSTSVSYSLLYNKWYNKSTTYRSNGVQAELLLLLNLIHPPT